MTAGRHHIRLYCREAILLLIGAAKGIAVRLAGGCTVFIKDNSVYVRVGTLVELLVARSSSVSHFQTILVTVLPAAGGASGTGRQLSLCAGNQEQSQTECYYQRHSSIFVSKPAPFHQLAFCMAV